MARVKTSRKPAKSSKKLKSKSKRFDISQVSAMKLKKGVKLEEHDPTHFLRDQNSIKQALAQAFFDGDVDAIKDILAAHLRVVSKDKISEVTGVSRATVFRMLDHKSNPSFENVLKVVSSLKLTG